jgi:hypothetical protein
MNTQDVISLIHSRLPELRVNQTLKFSEGDILEILQPDDCGIYVTLPDDKSQYFGQVIYDTVSGTVDYPTVDSIENLLDDLDRASNHIYVETKTAADNGGELPIGWCY